jgi:uncharacterized cupredoxin-like copper-binding protein
MSRRKRTLAVPVAIVAGGLVALGCGSDSGTTTAAETNSASTPAQSASGEGAGEEAAAAAKAITIDMGEYYYRPKNATAKAGSVTISARNIGKLPHELVLARTNVAPSALPTLPDGSVDEEKLEAQGKAPGEIPETLGGKTKSGTIKLPAGRYVMYCNIPGHYAAGMYGTLVTE